MITRISDFLWHVVLLRFFPVCQYLLERACALKHACQLFSPCAKTVHTVAKVQSRIQPTKRWAFCRCTRESTLPRPVVCTSVEGKSRSRCYPSVLVSSLSPTWFLGFLGRDSNACPPQAGRGLRCKHLQCYDLRVHVEEAFRKVVRALGHTKRTRVSGGGGEA